MSIRVGFPKVRDIKIGKQRIYALKANKKEERWAIDTTRTWKSYGTWSISVWVNTAHFGEALAEEIKKVRVITHNEDSEFTPEDLREEIMERVQEWAYLEAENL